MPLRAKSKKRTHADVVGAVRERKRDACIFADATALRDTDAVPQRIGTDNYYRDGVVFVIPPKTTKGKQVQQRLQRGTRVRYWGKDLPDEVFIIWAIFCPANGTIFQVVVVREFDLTGTPFPIPVAAITEVS